MTRRRSVSVPLAMLACAAAIATSLVAVRGQTAGQATVRVDADDIGGVVMGARAPEAGVWVIAETTELPTPLRKIVVTDDQGRYLVPDLPKATYDVWVRGYGLVDSSKIKSAPGKQVNLTAVSAPNAKAAAEYYPAQYWLSMLRVPPKSDFPGTGPNGNGIATTVRSQGEWIRNIVNTDGCTGCHQMGNKATREIPKALGTFDNSAAAWERRVQSGQAGAGMLARFNQIGKARALAMWGEWSDRIAGGALPASAPPRPQGRERNVVVTMWDWADPKAYLHDEIASDKRNPTVNANGPVYGAMEEAADYMPVVEPKTNAAAQVPLQVRDPEDAATGAACAVIALLGRGVDLDGAVHRAQLRDGRPQPRVDRRADPAQSDLGVLSQGFDPSVCAGVPDRAERPADADVRPEDEEGHDHRHLLRHASPELR